MQSRLALFLSALWLSLAGCVASATPPAATVLPMRPLGTEPAVDVLVNGRGPYLFLIDTGASGKARIDSSVVEALGMRVVGQTTASGAMGQGEVPINRVEVQSLTVGDRVYGNLAVLSRSYNSPGEYVPDIGGILALGLFEDQLLTLDYPARQVRIEEGSLPPADGRTILDVEMRGGVMFVPIRVGELTVEAEIDTGSDRYLDLPTKVIRKLHLATFPRPIGQVAGLTGSVNAAETIVRGELQIGQHRIAKPEVTFAETFEFPILGSAFLHDFILTIDQRSRRIRLVRSAGR
jgi:predicted aspartyl protease